jgi:hypothetical protein
MIKNILKLLMIILVSSPSLLHSEENKYAFAKQQDLNTGAYRGYCLISVKKSQIEIGKEFSVDICFTNIGGGDDFYNPFFDRLIPLSAMLAIYNSKMEYIGDLLFRDGGSQKTVTSTDWQFIPSGCYVGTQLIFTAGYIPGTPNVVTSNLLPPGEYYLQMIYYKTFIDVNPYRLISNPPKNEKTIIREFYKSFNRDVLFRSNSVKIILIRNEKGS